jgi:uncharacterized integral membrane protein (TIGR00698 family)
MEINRLVPTVSPLLLAILFGAGMVNVGGIPSRLQAGVDFAAKRLLRLGIALLGLQLVLADVFGLGWGMVAVVVMIVGFGILGTMYMGKRLGIGFTQRVLIACGFSICGAAAVAATDGVIDADEEEVATSVALVVVFGTVMIPALPLMAHALGLSEATSGMWAGGAIHEVAQVVAAGGAMGPGALAFAVVVKLARVMMLAPVMAVLSVRQRSRQADRPPLVPLFVLGFTAMVLLRSASILPDDLIAFAKIVQTALLTAAMFALGLGIRMGVLRSVGIRPLILATFATLWVSGIALVGVLAVSR